MKRLLLLFALVFFAQIIHATTIHVPADQPTIQAGINAAVTGDTVLVAPGTYNEQFNFNGKSIVVRSSGGAAFTKILGATIIDQDHPTVWINQGENASTKLEGFTFQGGPIAIRIGNTSHPTVRNNILTDQTYASWAALVIESQAEIINNTICHGANGGVACYNSQTNIKNNIIAYNNHYSVYGAAIITYCDVYSNPDGFQNGATGGTGTISADPMFVNEPARDYHLSDISPCINTGDPNPIYNDPDGSRNDIGALPLRLPGIIHVPLDKATIQAGIDFAIDGDTVLVADGHYYERISYLGKAITVASEYPLDGDTMHIANTIIDGDTTIIPIINDIGAVVRFVNGEDSLSTLIGITVKNGIGTMTTIGGGIYANATPRILDCYFTLNSGAGASSGAAADIRNGGIVRRCKIYGNGTGYGIVGYSISVKDCELMNNGGGIRSIGNSRIDNCHIAYNRGGMRPAEPQQGDSILNCVFENNIIGAGYNASSLSTTIVNSSNSDPRDQRKSTMESGASFLDENDTHFIGCTFLANGTALSLIDEHVEISNCIFDGNNRVITGNNDVQVAIYNCIIQHTTEEAIRLPSYYHESRIESTLFIENSSYAINSTIGIIRNCDFISNAVQNGTAIYRRQAAFRWSPLTVENCTFAYNGGTGPIECAPDTGTTLSISCTDSYGNAGGDWNGCMAPFSNINGNMSVNPFFCDTTEGDYRVWDFSACAPANNSCNAQIGAHGVGCIGTPSASGLVVLDEVLQNVISHQPKFSWIFSTPIPYPEDSFEVQVGTDVDWAVAEMWNPEVAVGPDTAVIYGGAPLMDGTTYYVRVRVHNGLTWSPWVEASFRMNSLASAPIASRPIGGATLTTLMPALYLYNSTDPEGDAKTYDFEVYLDTLSGSPVAAVTGVAEQADSTEWVVTPALSDNNHYFWRARAFDGYEYSDWSPYASFWVNAIEEAPSTFAVISPINSGNSQTYDIAPVFSWGSSSDPDPRDSVYYTLRIGIDSFFLFYSTIDSIYTTQRQVNGLQLGWHYWWKVAAHDTKGNITWSSNVAHLRMWVLGDTNMDGSVNVGDAVFLINLIFKSGPWPIPFKAGDVNGDCSVNVGDAVYLINHIFKGGLAPKVGCAEGK